jgi:catechol 1,2-dioxygenase
MVITLLFSSVAFLTAGVLINPCRNAFSVHAAPIQDASAKCTPTPADMLGPFYEPDAPVRSSVGRGYTLTGAVMSSKDCRPIKEAKIEFWLAGPKGSYDAEHRATMFSAEDGIYRFESNYPPSYSGRPPHIHIKVSAEGHETLVTQHYPERGSAQGTMDLVLRPSK